MRTPKMLVLAALVATPAAADIVSFEDLVHGEVVNDQYVGMGLSISAINFNQTFDVAVAFNSNLTGTADPDLEAANITVGNLAGTNARLGNLLIIQENNTGIETGFATNPDDEGARAAGQIILEFDKHMLNFGFDVVDVDDEALENSSVAFFSGDAFVTEVSFADFLNGSRSTAGVQYGDGSANRIDPIQPDFNFNRVEINVGGSMAFDNFNFTVPAPSAALTLGSLALLAPRRRRR